LPRRWLLRSTRSEHSRRWQQLDAEIADHDELVEQLTLAAAPRMRDASGHTYISFMLAAGYDVPYVQAQVGHEDPTTTLGVYARVIRQPNRDRLRKQMTALLGSSERHDPPDAATPATLF
jgi:hypothetical protein